jgi:hypothetical protein
MNPFSGGNPTIAADPTTITPARTGMRLASPPNRSRSRVPADRAMAPTPRNNAPFISEWLSVCNSAPPTPSTATAGRCAATPIRPIPRPMAMIPMFSTVLYARSRFTSRWVNAWRMPQMPDSIPIPTRVQPHQACGSGSMVRTRTRP